MLRGWLGWVLLWLAAGIVQAAPLPLATHPIQVFRVSEADGTDTLTFVDMVTGETTTETVTGERYTIIGDRLLYYDPAEASMMELAPGSPPQRHPFIQPTAGTRRLDWVVATDQRTIAWTETSGPDDSALVTVTRVASVDGDNVREVLTDGPRDGIRAQPIAFSTDTTTLYMDYQPVSLGELTPYREYAGLFQVDLETGGFAGYLPGEPGCFCGAGIGGGQFVRLALADDLAGFDLLVTDLAADVTREIEGVNLRNYTQGGDVLITPDGSQAVYALAQVRDFGTPAQSVQTVFVLADLRARTQRELTNPLFNYLRPIAWTENNSAIILTATNNNSTWKLNLENGRLEEIARATYIGLIMKTER